MNYTHKPSDMFLSYHEKWHCSPFCLLLPALIPLQQMVTIKLKFWDWLHPTHSPQEYGGVAGGLKECKISQDAVLKKKCS